MRKRQNGGEREKMETEVKVFSLGPWWFEQSLQRLYMPNTHHLHLSPSQTHVHAHTHTHTHTHTHAFCSEKVIICGPSFSFASKTKENNCSPRLSVKLLLILNGT